MTTVMMMDRGEGREDSMAESLRREAGKMEIAGHLFSLHFTLLSGTLILDGNTIFRRNTFTNGAEISSGVSFFFAKKNGIVILSFSIIFVQLTYL